MVNRIGIRLEDKNEWEKRVPIVPMDAGRLIREHGVGISVQPMPNRAFSDAEYMAIGASTDKELAGCDVIIGIKEMPVDFFLRGKTYIFFSHVIKGQEHNMPLLKRLMELECNLLDYEKITDEKGIRQVFFGSEAGQAGMIDTLWALGQRLNEKEIGNPFIGVRQAPGYRSLTFAETALEAVGREIASNGLADEIHPVVFGFAGYGNVSKGAQEILNNLPVIEISPDELLNPNPDTFSSNKHVYKVVFYEKDMVEPVDKGGVFELQDYYDNPEKYRGVFSKFIPHLTVLMNCIFWTDDYPRLLVKDQVVEMYSSGDPKLIVIGDISCDIDGAVEVTVKATDPGNPIYVYDVDSGLAIDGVKGNGPVILAVDNLPCELPREASTRFSGTLRDFIPDLVKADFSVGFDQLDLPEPLKRSVIIYHGKLTPEYEYLNEFLNA
ncbi:hypothetical protein KAU08_00075 [bacterium]|nr:hypothetical protein [bacterium]